MLLVFTKYKNIVILMILFFHKLLFDSCRLLFFDNYRILKERNIRNTLKMHLQNQERKSSEKFGIIALCQIAIKTHRISIYYH